MMQRAVGLLVLVAMCFFTGNLVRSADKPVEEQDFSGELPRIAPLEPAAALKTFNVQPGFRIDQVAAEPLVVDPVAIAFDEDARLYAVEMRDYSEQDKESLGTIRLLEDTDGDGRFDRSEVFAENLSWPTAIACWDGGVFVGAAPDIWYFKDTDGDHKADVRKKVFTGFQRDNVQGLMNSFHWTLDNRIHGATSSSGGRVQRVDKSADAGVLVRGRDFEFDPRTMKLNPTSGGAQHGLSFDDWGHKFVCSNSDHAQQVMYEDRYIARNRYLAAPGPRVSIAADGPQAEVFRSSPVEPWRVVRTRLRVSGVVQGAVEGGGRAAGYFTGATGVTVYRGNAFPQELRGMFVVGDVGSNLIHRKQARLNGVQYVAERMDKDSEFVASSDIWFRPAQYENAPDGTLYICDVYREVIEHPKSIPEMIKKHLDLTSGRDRGRIYRALPDGFQQPALPKLSTATTEELVALLAHDNAWHRETASRLIYQRQDQSAVVPLEKLAFESESPLGRMHALYALDGLKQLPPGTILRALHDPSPRVREHAVRLAERMGIWPEPIVRRLLELADDDDMQVRYQVAFTLGELGASKRVAPLTKILQRDASDRWMRLAVYSSLSDGAEQALSTLANDEPFRENSAARVVYADLARLVGARNDSGAVAAVFDEVSRLPSAENSAAAAIIRGLSEGLVQAGKPIRGLIESNPTAAKIISQLLTTAAKDAQDEKLREPRRVDAVETLALGNLVEEREVFTKLLESRQTEAVRQAALGTLSRFRDPAVGALVLEAWPTLGPRLRSGAIETLFARPERLLMLLDAIDAGTVAASELDSVRLRMLADHRDAKVKERAQAILASNKLARRQDVVDSYRSSLTLSGDVDRGRATFRKICVACHKAEGMGHEIGPNLATIRNRGAESILLNVLDPSREVNPEFVNYMLLVDDGRVVTGLMAAETATSVTLRRSEGASDTVLRANIEELRSTGLSIMPEGLEKQIDPQSLADVIAYLMTLK